jgi:hypothetical protein
MIAAVLLLSIPAAAQSPADLLQKGIYAQETAGDLDGAIQIFRQVANSSNKSIAAQAQYQLVLCMVQRGDRAGAAKEVETLARNFPDQAELVTKARRLLPGAATILPAPWGEAESSQLNIKRDGVATGEYLYYSIDSNRPGRQPVPTQQWLWWELTTKKSKRSASAAADRATGQLVGQPHLALDNYMGDPAVEPLAGPAIDTQLSVFALRRLPLAVGYKTTLPTLPFTLESLLQKDVELAVTAIEPVAVTAGKFRCYKVSFGSIGQTFWIGVEGSRPLVKFQAGNIEAELVRTWGPEDFFETELAFFHEAGWRTVSATMYPGSESRGTLSSDLGPGEGAVTLFAEVKKVYTSAAEIPEALRADLKPCLPGTIQMRMVGGQQAGSCMVPGDPPTAPPWYHTWIRSESAAIHLNGYQDALAVFKWRVDRALANAKRIP